MQVLHGIPAVLVALVDWAAGEQDCAARVRVVQDMAAKRDCRVHLEVSNNSNLDVGFFQISSNL